MQKRSLTLMEVLVVTIIMAVFVAILGVALVQTRSVFETTDILVRLQENARLAISKPSNDLMRTSISQVTITQDVPSAGTDRIVYFLPQDADSNGVPDYTTNGATWEVGSVSVSLDPSGTGYLLKSEGGNTTVVAQNVKSVRFKDYLIDSGLYMDELQIVLEMEKTSYDGRVYNSTSTSVINMRNK